MTVLPRAVITHGISAQVKLYFHTPIKKAIALDE